MKIALSLALALLGTAQEEQKAYSNADLNLVFQHPKKWAVATKGYEATMTVPVEGGNATLEIKGAVFYSDSVKWEQSQEALAKTQKREIVRQWREDLLGVPWLLIQTKGPEGGKDQMRVTGLMYSATRKKLLYHLTADPGAFEKADEQVRAAFATMRTIDGTLPAPEDPDREKNAKEMAIALKSPPIVLRDLKQAKVVRGAVKVAAKTAGLDVNLHLPAGWTAEKLGDDTFALKRSGLAGTLKVKVQSTLDSDSPERALIKTSSETGKQFTKIDKREDRRVASTMAGAKAWSTWRAGAGPGGPMVVIEAVGSTKDFYWLLAGQWTSEGAYRKDARLIDSLIGQMSVELPS